MKLSITTRRRPSFWSCNFQCNLLHVKFLSAVAGPTHLFEDIDYALVQADFASYASILRKCTSCKSLLFGQLVHDHIVKAGLEGDSCLPNLVMNMYGHFDGSLPTASWLFSKMSHPDLFSWNFIIRAYQHSGLYIEALELFQQMLGQGGVLPDQHIYASVLSVCANVNSIKHAKQLHVHVIWNGFEPEIIIATSLINMYARCGSMDDAWLMFDRMPLRDIITWSTLISACIEHNCGKLAVQLMKQFHEEGILPNKDIILASLAACSHIRVLTEGKQIHASIVGSDFNLDSAIQTSLSNMYMHCTKNNSLSTSSSGEHNNLLNTADQSRGRPLPADTNTSPDQFSGERRAGLVGSLQGALKKFSQEGLICDALQILEQMKSCRILPDRYSLATLISACAGQSAVLEGEQVYAFINENHLELDGHLSTALIRLFGKSGKLEVAIELFDRISIHDVVSWTAMINAYAQNGESKEALVLYRQMKLRGIQPNEMTFASVLDACIFEDSLTEGQQVHQEIIDSKAEQNLFVGTALVNMYARFGYLEDATIVFDRMPCRDVVAWNALLTASAHYKNGGRLFQQFIQMQEEGILPNKATFISILNASASYTCLFEGKQRHIQTLALDYKSDLVVGTALIHMYGKCKCLTIARFVYDMISNKDIFFCSAMLAAYAHDGKIKEAFAIFDEMLSRGIEPDNISCISILSACVSKMGLDDGRLMHMRSIFCGLDQDARVRSGLINMYGKYGSLEDAIRTLEVASTRERDAYVSVLSACANQPDLVEGRRMHMHVVEMGLELELPVGNALINMYGKCGILQEARVVFEKLPEHDIVSWTVMISSHAQHGQGDYALHLFDLMQLKGIHPNKVTFTNILNAFSHAGMVDEGFQCFGYVCQERSTIQPLVDHYNVMVDLLGKAGRLNEAEDLIKKMPFSTTACTWTSMLGACRSHLDIERGERLAENVFRMRPSDRAPYIMMHNMYASVGRSEDAQMFFTSQRKGASYGILE